jgi:lipopolysaccharide export system protein LptA
MKVSSTKIFFAGILTASFLVIPSVFPACAASAGKNDKQNPTISEKIGKSESPIQIVADRMEVQQAERVLVFDGHVVVRQDDVTITGHRLKVTGLPPEKGKNKEDSISEKIDYIEVDGDVKVTQKDRIATAEKAIFYQREQKVVMRGHPSVTKGKDRIEGTTITIYLLQGRSVVEGGKEAPVQAVLFPGKKE